MADKTKVVTRKDVAEYAGVSPTVVSYVVNNNRYVSADKRKRVLEAIEKLNYKPNVIALGLKSKKTYHIAFICDDISNEHFARIVMEMESLAYTKGYIVSFCQTRNDDEYINQLISRQFDGMIISSDIMSEAFISKLAETGTPIVLLGNRIYNDISDQITFVNIDIYGGAKKAVEYLLSKGHRDIAFLDNFLHGNGEFSECDLRFKAYKELLNKNNIDINPNYIIKVCDNYESVFKKCTELFSLNKRPTAILANDDMHAFVAVSAANSLNLKVPQDMAVIGFDNSSVSKFMIPALTTVGIPKKEISRVSLELLINKIEGKSVKDANLETELIIRKSTN